MLKSMIRLRFFILITLICVPIVSLISCQIQEPFLSEQTVILDQYIEGKVIMVDDDDRLGAEVTGGELSGALAGTDVTERDAFVSEQAGAEEIDMGIIDMGIVDMTGGRSEVADADISIDMESAGEESIRTGSGDTMPLACVGAYCPSARISAMMIPDSPMQAEMVGCQVVGMNRGTSLNTLLALFGDTTLNNFVQPDDNGEMGMIILNHLAGWSANQSGNEVSEVNSHFYIGQSADDGSFMIRADSLSEEGMPQITFPNTAIVNTLYQTPYADFTFTFPLAGIPLTLRLSYTDISGLIETDDLGFRMTEGVINGYLTEDTIVSIMSDISRLCMSSNAPSICDSLGALLSGIPANDAILLSTILGGYDTLMSSEGQPSACTNNTECNALSVCLQIEMSSITISGIAD